MRDVKKIKDDNYGTIFLYELTIVKSNVIAFLESLKTEIVNIKGANDPSISSIDEMLTYLKDPATDADFNYITSNIFTNITVNAEGIPVGGIIRFRAVPTTDIEHLSGKQLDTILSVSLIELNKSVSVTPPATFITAKEADELLSKSMPSGF